jgi:hypothetical protein
MDLHPMDTLAWETLIGAPACFLVGAGVLWLLARVRSRSLYWALATPTVAVLFVAPALSAVRIVNRFADYDHCVDGGAARFGAGGDCPQWTVDAYARTAPYREI